MPGLRIQTGHGLSLIGIRIRNDFDSEQNADVVVNSVIEAGVADPFHLHMDPNKETDLV